MDNERNIDPLVSMQQELCDMWGINNQTKYVFYYDESNNCRKFWVDDSKQQFNTDYTADFVLAGLVKKEEDIVDVSLETFRKPLKLQGNVEEIKLKKLYAKGDFLQCVKEKRLFETLLWIDKSPFYIHYTNVNNLFYTLVEIFDSIVKPDEISEFGYNYFKMKSVFYYMFKGKADELQILMFKYKYPNIQREDVEAFCNELLFLLGSRREMKSDGAEIATLIKSIATMKKTWMPLYEQYTDGKLSREDFLVEKKKYDEETARLEQRLQELQSRQEIQQESNQQIEKNISQLNCYADQMELTEEIKEKLIDKVNVYSDNRIEICWNFESGFLDRQTVYKSGQVKTVPLKKR